jgi:glycine/D-amino acid oxidase-like deaminating enzyme
LKSRILTPAPPRLARRRFLAAGGLALAGGLLNGCAVEGWRPPRTVPAALRLASLRATPDRITALTVCTRPFRAQGPRLDVEQIGNKTIVHNYGHGGSGWSLSWGSSAIVVEKALAGGDRDVGVIGCGALGLTSALLLQRAGARVTIYAKELPPNVRSSLATGLWTPDSRVCFADQATPAFRELWSTMAHRSFATYQSYLGLPGTPVEYLDMYYVRDSVGAPARGLQPQDTRPRFAELQRELLGDITPHAEEFAPGSHNLGDRTLRRNSQLMFNIAPYARLLLADFMSFGGRIEIREFHAPADFAPLPQRTLINATGYGARALFADRSIIPVRGQLARMIPQPGIDYGLIYRDSLFAPRRDGSVFQVIGLDDYYGFDNDSELADRAEAEHAVATIAGLYDTARRTA